MIINENMRAEIERVIPLRRRYIFPRNKHEIPRFRGCRYLVSAEERKLRAESFPRKRKHELTNEVSRNPAPWVRYAYKVGKISRKKFREGEGNKSAC